MAHDSNGHDDHHGHHIIPEKVYFTVFAILIGLTVLTVYTAKHVDLGPLNLVVALAIAFGKALLVILFFMALKYDKKINALVFSLGAIFVLIFMVFTLLDTSFRGYVNPDRDGTVAETERANSQLQVRDSLITPQLQAQPLVYDGDPTTDIVVDSTQAN